ncbi:MAG: flagellar assembly protein FliW [Peptococcaceae bacterium]|jgi:flagellar assembly factor FliW|nr:flagellar assembly protein FliW [Peptococcaceae bacterium]MDR2737131.1 flagellar assembly protein FliW [Gracilibacteraceae bacterium]
MREDSVIVQFPKGIPGFEEYENFAMTMEEDTPLAHLTVHDDEDCGFLLLQPQALFDEYAPDVSIDDHVTSLLELQEGEPVEMWVIVTLGQDVRESTANLRAPLLINRRTHKGVQMIIDNDVYQSKQPLFH